MITEQLHISLNNPIMSNHKVYGQALLPGLAYIDLIYQVFQEHGFPYQELELKNLTIFYPLTADESHDIALTIHASESKEGTWSIIIDGQKQHGESLSDKRQYVTAEMRRKERTAFAETINLNQWKSTADRILNLDDLYEQCRSQQLVHTGMMKAEGQIYETKEGALIDLSVGQEALLHSEAFLFHPTLIDGSGIGSSCLLSEQTMYLPLCYESFSASERLQKGCTARILSSSVCQKKELTYMTVEYFNSSGQKVAELKQFAGKSVRDGSAFHSAKEIQEERHAVSQNTGRDYTAFETYLRQLLAEQLERPAEQMDIHAGYYELGLDSPSLLKVVQEIGAKIGADLSPTLLFEYTTIAELAAHLAEHYSMGETDETVRQSPKPMQDSSDVAPSLREFGEDIAIIGMAGRYPKAKNIQEFWENLKAGTDCITEIPNSRWEWKENNGLDSPSGKPLSKWGGFIEDADCFDPQFFRISPREAETMDPQERLFLETCWEAIEDAGYTPETIASPQGENKRQHVGVFAGVMHKDYSLIGAEALSEQNAFPLSLNYAQIANRVSYYCNFHGPSMAVDTVCSSSLTAVHLAIESIRNGECEAALAGGVNLSLHPAKYISYGSVGMHSSDGYCHTFGKGGDGYVSGEGVGTVLLKPLRKAEQDGDRIYAVIKGSAINHVGKVSGITVPSPVAQADVIEACLEKTGIDPRTISYVEAHGTGTSLGDPIEIQGLVKAFSRNTQDKQFCSIGSVKSNIGHAESAAGISGLTKTVLQLHHKTLVPSLHSEESNPYLQLDQTPFFVQHETKKWEQPSLTENGMDITYPRRAGLSSFGASGSNAHLILEEYIPAESFSEPVLAKNEQIMIPLSARNKDRLQAYALKLLDFLSEDINIVALAYTLQAGRVEMEERAAFIVKDIKDLTAKLRAFANGDKEIDGCWTGQAKENQEAAGPTSENALRNSTITDSQLKKMAESWVQGKRVIWDELYGDRKPLKISVPTYPFAKERYWIPAPETKTSTVDHTLHPLVHRNTSDFTEQRFSSVFTGKEFFLSDHVVQGQKILPGVAYLEMAREAAEKAAGDLEGEQRVVSLKDIVWIRPITIGSESKEIHIGLYPEDNGDISFDIYSSSENKEETPMIHSQGRAVISAEADTPVLDLASIQTECNLDTVTSEQCYTAFRKIGLDYGKGYQGIEKVLVGQDRLLAKISLPAFLKDGKQHFTLHPSLMDSAFHATVGFIVSSVNAEAQVHQLSLPFALQQLDVFSPCPEEIWSYIRYSSDSKAEDKVRKYDIDLCDENGNVCVRMKGASMRALDGEQTKPQAAADSPLTGHTMMIPAWEPVSPNGEDNASFVGMQAVLCGGTEGERMLIKQHHPLVSFVDIRPADDTAAIADKLQACGDIDHVLWIAPSHPENMVSEGQGEAVLQAFKLVKACLQLGYGEKKLEWSFVTVQAQPVTQHETVHPAHASIHGLAGTIAKEYPHWNIRLLDLEEGCTWPVHQMFMLPADHLGHTWAYRNQQWHQQQLIPYRHSPSNDTLYRTGGVYVVIGGAGYIGEAWSEYMIRRYQAQIVWIGRSQINDAIQAKVDRLSELGPEPYYISADAADLHSLQQAYDQVKKRHPHIHGIVHSAMVLFEQSLENMTLEEFETGLAAKVDASVRTAQVFQHERLDFVLFFSSLVAHIKNVKQSHYASGCAFADAFAHQLSQSWACPVKVMNWGYWGNSEAAEDEQYVQLMNQIGLGLIEPAEGMKALEALLSGPVSQTAFIHTTKPVAVEGVNQNEFITLYPEHPSADAESLKERLPKTGQVQRVTHEELDDLLYRLLLGQLQTAGLFDGHRLSVECLQQYKTREFYEKWLQQSSEFLLQHDYLKKDGDSLVRKNRAEDIALLWQEWNAKKEKWLKDSNTKAMVVLAETMLKALPDILTGEVPATDIMFPHSSMELVEGIYKQNQVADYFNKVLADTLIAYLDERLKHDPEASIRIMEIGAGTGGTSAGIFQKLKAYQNHIKEYCYTDLSKAFLLHAEKEYGAENPYLTYQLFDVEKPIDQQEIEAGGYDVVIAANVLHATKNIRQTLRHTKAVMKNNGMLLLNEMAGNSLFPHITFGLLEGWWLYEDPAVRIPGCPGLYPNSWKSALESEGFESVFFPAEAAHDLSHQIVAASSNGLVRRMMMKSAVSSEKDVSPASNKEQAYTQNIDTQKDGQSNTAALREKSTEYMKKLIGETLKIPAGKIESSEPLEKYGIDSIVVVQLTNTLRKEFDHVSSTLFFEYQTIDALVEHLIKTKSEALMKLTGLDRQVQQKTPAASKNESLQKSGQAAKRSRRFRKLGFSREKEMPTHALASRDVAVIGISGRYPQAETAEDFWNNLKEGRNCIEEIPKERWDWKAYYDKEKGKEGSIYTKWGGFIKDMDKFDPLFFQISPLEAERMDPQERLFLQTAYASIEDAGYTPDTLCTSRKIGVFAGVMNKNYPTGYGYWSIANRISYLLNFQGPSLAVDTACSSSLTAIHLALESIYSGSSDCAIAGGVNLVVDPIHYQNLSVMNMLSASDTCKSFGDDADGFVDGEGVGAIVLKPLQQAIADGDHIYGVIKASAINSGGKTNGYTVPNPHAQAQVIKEAIERANIPARTISYVEAHGTGTALGDPIEIAGLTKAFEEDTQEKQFCAIGSSKSNIGHCESAAGIAGLTKILFQFKYGQIAPSLHSQRLNPNIEFNHTPFVVQQDLGEWKRPVIDGQEVPRRAGLSSFGAGGSNAHMILEEYIQRTEAQTPEAHPPALIVLSAKNMERLQEKAEQLLTAIQGKRYREQDLIRIAYTLQTGREAMEERLGFIAESLEDLERKLNDFIENKTDSLYLDRIDDNKKALAVLSADEDTEKIIEAWMSKGKYTKLLDLWVKGLSFDWGKLYETHKPIRISLPAYPFAKERYWAPGTAKAPAPIEQHHEQQTEEHFEVMTFKEVWKEEPASLTSKRFKTLICFLTDREKQNAFAASVKNVDQDTKVIFISQGEVYVKQSQNSYQIVRQQPATFEKAFQSIQDEHGEPDAVLYMWPAEDASCIKDHSLIVYLLQGMSAAKLHPSRLLLAGRFENGLDRSYLESWIGFERSLGLVLPHTKVTGIFQPAEQKSMDDWARKIWTELQASTEQTVLYQNGKRYVSHIEQTAIQPNNSKLKSGGTYLITGGLGGLGYLFAKHLAKHYAANVILTGRSPFNEEKQKKIKEVKDLGGEAMYAEADVSDPIAMGDCVKRGKDRFGAINGVIHAAGVESDSAIFDKEIESFQRIIEPKINGTIALDEWLKNENLDFICYFSSSSAILGDFGCCDYAIGNRFQMAYAQYRNELHSGKTFVINWPVWKDGGMKIGDEETTDMYLKSSGQRFLEADEGIRMFEHILSQQDAQHLVIAGQPSRVSRFLGMTEPIQEPAIQAPAAQEKRGEIKTLSIEKRLEHDLKEHIHALLKISKDKLNLNKNWADFGFDSIYLAKFSNVLSKHFNIEVPPALFFGYSTLQELIRFFLTDHKELIEAFYRDDASEAQKPSEADAPVSVEPETNKKSVRQSHAEPIAIIGMSGRFPQADSVHELWDNLKNGKDCISEIPKERWDWGRANRDPEKAVPRWGAFLKDIDRFDPLFFQISPKEAESMDPRQRIFLEEAWHTFEDAGYMGHRIKGKSCGVYVGVEEGEYAHLTGDTDYINGTQNATLSARIAYVLDLKGPNMALTAACSSGLVAIHQACSALRQGDCEMALAGGVSLNISQMSFEALTRAEMLSPNGQCKVFDQDANGLVPGEAVAAVLLKPLSKAIEDKDHIYGCIKASGVNYDGKTNGITAPNPFSQAELIENIYEKNEINPLDIQYVMAHSTGSNLGDPLEVQALTSVFSKYTKQKQFCMMSSIKPLIGHTFAASGVVALISMLMAMKNQTIPATHHCESDNPYIQFKESPFVLCKENRPWIRENQKPRMGTISTTGISGTNAHAVIEEYIPDEQPFTQPHKEPAECPQVIVLSAQNDDRLQDAVTRMIVYLEQNHNLSLPDVAYTLQVGRKAMEARLAIVVNNQEQLVRKLKEYAEAMKNGGVSGQQAFLYTGHTEGMLEEQDEAFLQAFAKERNLESIAECWVKGYQIPWELLHEGDDVRMLPLPGYPFARERYWVSSGNHQSESVKPHTQDMKTEIDEPNRETHIQKIIVQFLARELGISEDRINFKRNFLDYGMDSILGRKLMRHIEKTTQMKMTGREILECQTVQALSAHLTSKTERHNQSAAAHQTKGTYTDEQIIRLMQEVAQGKLDFKSVQNIIEGSKSYES
ncbi:SDR family NAD(P)-dependent oxidoreductase [Bacillus inaquosorum]|uniref:SDR family NAD(P)-dependent oxidoreductase n=1 Tax=Bacillus inaquosorum TaxID=483913 RepID=UPI00227E063A|nr:SDR family NAD(P)-dependent oxidoreductase [Bacillus inaquosorum]MCY8787193.1 SDR family NAD(P)-dependent oxidoreductase [Bacillus inaquosorum]